MMYTANSTDMNILIVEDSPELAQMTLATLRRVGMKSYHAATGEEAVEAITQHNFDLVLLDLGLPDMSGWDVLRFIRRQYGEYGTPVIVTTAYSDNINRAVGRLQFVNRYLVKPFLPQNLIEAIQDVLELYKAGV